MVQAFRDVLAVQGARALIGSALDLSSTAPGVPVPPDETVLVGDPHRVKT